MFLDRLFLLRITSDFREVVQFQLQEYVRKTDCHNVKMTRELVYISKLFSVIKTWVGPFGL